MHKAKDGVLDAGPICELDNGIEEVLESGFDNHHLMEVFLHP